MKIYRHGDVLIQEIKAIPKAAKKAPLPDGRRILAHGEATGHAHVLDQGTLYERDGNLYFSAPKGAALQHEEHGRIDIPAGKFSVTIQREYSPSEIRRVVD